MNFSKTSPDRRSFLKASAALGASPLLSLTNIEASKQVVTTATAAPLAPASGVKVKDVRTYKLRNAIFVQVMADNGMSGWGEASPNNRHVVETFIHTGLKEHVIGRNVWDAEPMWDDMFFDNHDLGPDGVLPYSIAGIDCALWDLKGKLIGLPVYKLLGGEYRNKMRAYCSFGLGLGNEKPKPRPKTIDEAVRLAMKFVERGFTVVKPRTQFRERKMNPYPDPTFDYMKAIRQAVGDKVELFVCLNSSYNAARGIEMCKRLHEELGINYAEEVVSTHNLSELAQVVEALPFPIIAGETEYHRWRIRELIEMGKVSIINPDVVKCGGLTEAKKIAALAQASNKQIAPHNTKPTFSTAATLHFCASTPNAGPFVEFVDTDDYKEVIGTVRNSVEFKDGYLYVPQTPGLGIEVDEAAVKRAVVS